MSGKTSAKIMHRVSIGNARADRLVSPKRIPLRGFFREPRHGPSPALIYSDAATKKVGPENELAEAA